MWVYGIAYDGQEQVSMTYRSPSLSLLVHHHFLTIILSNGCLARVFYTVQQIHRRPLSRRNPDQECTMNISEVAHTREEREKVNATGKDSERETCSEGKKSKAPSSKALKDNSSTFSSQASPLITHCVSVAASLSPRAVPV